MSKTEIMNTYFDGQFFKSNYKEYMYANSKPN